MDHFYTAVEGHERREIRGNPVIGYLIPDVEKGEVLVESLGQGSFQRWISIDFLGWNLLNRLGLCMDLMVFWVKTRPKSELFQVDAECRLG